MSETNKRIALPAYLRKDLQSFRVGSGKEQKYLLRAKADGIIHEFEPWQFFVLQVLPGCEDDTQLISVFKDRFGHAITMKEVEELFSRVAEEKLFSVDADSHPLLKRFFDKRELQRAGVPDMPVQGDAAQGRSSPGAASTGSREASPGAGAAGTHEKTGTKPSAVQKEPIPGVSESIGLDDKRGWKLFDPTGLIRLLHSLLLPFRHSIFLLPLLLIAAVIIFDQHTSVIIDDFKSLLGDDASFLKNALTSMVTVNLSVTLVTAMVAYHFRATVHGLCVVFYLFFFPRFMVRIGHVEQLSRRERIWLHAAPLLMRLALFSTGILVWFYSRNGIEPGSSLALTTAAAAAVSFLITLNPLVKSSGYNLLSAFLNEPHIRGKAYKALLTKIKGDVYRKTDNNVLVAYALASALFTLVLAAAMLYFLGVFLKIYLGGSSVLIVALLAGLLMWRMVVKFNDIAAAYDRSIQFERWRSRMLPEVGSDPESGRRPNGPMTYLRRSALLLALAALFLPYRYEVGGSFTVLPNQQQVITAEVDGIIETLNFDGGETIKKDMVIGQLSHSDYLAQVRICDAKILEQEAVISQLRHNPRPEEVQLATSALETQKTRAKFSEAKAKRLETLYKKGTIPFEDFEDARRIYEIDSSEVIEKTANLQLVEIGASPDELAAAEAKLLSYKEERNHYLEKIEQSTFRMPFDGRIVTMHLQQKIGSFLKKGEPLAVVENTEQVKVEIKVPEPDIAYIQENAGVRFRPYVYYDQEFYGAVSSIDHVVSEERHFGRVFNVITVGENKDGLLKSGMNGYAKISSEKMPLGEILSLSGIRFVKTEVWSWLP